MIEILQNKSNTEKIEFNAKDGDEVLGRCAGYIDGDVFVFDELECEDFFIDGLVRAILNLMDLHGIETARFDFTDMEIIGKLRKLGFVYNDENTIENIAEFFAGKKNCTKL